jgi:hypothetical protein
MRLQTHRSSCHDHDHLITRRSHFLVDLPEQFGEDPARSIGRYQPPTNLVRHGNRQPRTCLPGSDQVIELIVEITMPTCQWLLPGPEPVDYGAQPRAQAVDQDRPRGAAQRTSYVAGFQRCPMRRPPRSMIDYARSPFSIGCRIGQRAGRDVGHLSSVGKQGLGVARLAGTYAAGDQDAPVRVREIRIDEWGHRR